MNEKAIYMPKGKDGEYAKYACNFYKGCSNGCRYCYLKKGVLSKALGGEKPVLKSCFKDEKDALGVYYKELIDAYRDVIEHGVFFTFTSDPFLPETMNLNICAMCDTMDNEVPVIALTKCTDWIHTVVGATLLEHPRASKLLSVGFTLTGCDNLEPNASTNMMRIYAMRHIHNMGIRTWASIEPIIDIEASKRCIAETLGYCDEYKIGLLNGFKRDYSKEEVCEFLNWVGKSVQGTDTKVYLKESVRKFVAE